MIEAVDIGSIILYRVYLHGIECSGLKEKSYRKTFLILLFVPQLIPTLFGARETMKSRTSPSALRSLICRSAGRMKLFPCRTFCSGTTLLAKYEYEWSFNTFLLSLSLS